MQELERLAAIIETGQIREVAPYIHELLTQGIAPERIVSEGIMSGMSEVGRKFDAHEYFIPEMLMAARATKLGYAVLQDWLGRTVPVKKHKIVIGTVQDDLHDIGKNLVGMAMRNAGIEVIDLGVDVPPQQFVEAVEQDASVALVGISALLTTTIPALKETVAALKKCSASQRITIFVGGAPVTEKLAKAMGADVYTKTAFEAADAARDIIERLERDENETDIENRRSDPGGSEGSAFAGCAP